MKLEFSSSSIHDLKSPFSKKKKILKPIGRHGRQRPDRDHADVHGVGEGEDADGHVQAVREHHEEGQEAERDQPVPKVDFGGRPEDDLRRSGQGPVECEAQKVLQTHSGQRHRATHSGGEDHGKI